MINCTKFAALWMKLILPTLSYFEEICARDFFIPKTMSVLTAANWYLGLWCPPVEFSLAVVLLDPALLLEVRHPVVHPHLNRTVIDNISKISWFESQLSGVYPMSPHKILNINFGGGSGARRGFV